jgi:hypothetical protein
MNSCKSLTDKTLKTLFSPSGFRDDHFGSEFVELFPQVASLEVDFGVVDDAVVVGREGSDGTVLLAGAGGLGRVVVMGHLGDKAGVAAWTAQGKVRILTQQGGDGEVSRSSGGSPRQ